MWEIKHLNGAVEIQCFPEREHPLILEPFVQAYGVPSFPKIAKQQSDTCWEFRTYYDLLFNIEFQQEHDQLRIMFHVKPPIPQIGVRWKLQPYGPWYGMGERVIQSWPLEQAGAIAHPFITYDHAQDGTLNIGTPIWYAKSGLAILVDEDTGPLDASVDHEETGYITLVQHAPPVPFGTGIDGPVEVPAAQLNLRLIESKHLPDTIKTTLKHLGIPQGAPPLEMFTKPIWTTWARYKMPIDQQQTLQFAQEILEHEYPGSVIEIDDRWQRAYGDLLFDEEKFPDPAAMVKTLHQQGFKVTLWVPPFFTEASHAYHEANQHGFLVMHAGTEQPYLTRWWQGWGALLDVSNPAALQWWHSKLNHLQQTYGIDGFKFDGGEANFFPTECRTHKPIQRTEYTDIYVRWVAQHWEWTEVRTGWRVQACPIFFREWDKWSRWGLDNGLHAVITQALTMGIIGYPYILPDMIGGNAYAGEIPDRELLIRWTQVTALMPAMQFSIPPWDYDQTTIDICRRYTQLHRQLEPELSKAIQRVQQDGTPIVRPLWWDYPEDKDTWLINDQWLLGENLMAAPILYPGNTIRSIYFPDGTWEVFRDGEWHATSYSFEYREAYPAPLDTLPLFRRV